MRLPRCSAIVYNPPTTTKTTIYGLEWGTVIRSCERITVRHSSPYIKRVRVTLQSGHNFYTRHICLLTRWQLCYQVNNKQVLKSWLSNMDIGLDHLSDTDLWIPFRLTIIITFYGHLSIHKLQSLMPCHYLFLFITSNVNRRGLKAGMRCANRFTVHI